MASNSSLNIQFCAFDTDSANSVSVRPVASFNGEQPGKVTCCFLSLCYCHQRHPTSLPQNLEKPHFSPINANGPGPCRGGALDLASSCSGGRTSALLVLPSCRPAEHSVFFTAPCEIPETALYRTNAKIATEVRPKTSSHEINICAYVLKNNQSGMT